MLRVSLLGQFEVQKDGVLLSIPSRPAQSLLAYLLLTVGTDHRREKLAGLLWPDSSEENARNNLRTALWRLRKALGSDENERPYLLADDLSITFNHQADYWLDTSVLESGASSQATTEDLHHFLSHYRGELLPGFYDDWVVLERERLQAVFEQEVQRLLDILIAERRWAEVLDLGERWIAFGQTPEPAYRALMVAHYELGNRARIAATYQRCVEALRSDLGVEPAEQTRALYERLHAEEVGRGLAVTPSLREKKDETLISPLSPAIPALSYSDEPPAPRESRYHLKAELGRGRMGIVYRAHDDVLDRDVAVKVISTAGLTDEARERLLREARSTAQLNHPNIVAVYDAGESDGVPFIVEELVEGQSLHDCPPPSMDATMGIAIQVCAALDHGHAHGIVHRDLKPENVLLAEDGTVKLVDFGLALSAASRVTAEGTIVGTVYYLAPEQALGQPLDARADLYSLGVMLYELTAGQLPFTGDNALAVISQHLNAPVVPPRAHNDAILPALDALIVRLLSKQPEDRPASARQVAVVLSDIQRGQPALAAPVQELSLLDRIVRGRLVGRAAELSEAIAQLRRAMSGEGRVVLVSGEPGVGKTRLVRELMTHAQVSGVKTLLGECYAEGGAPYAPISQMLREDGTALQQMPLSESVLADLLSLAPNLRTRFPSVTPNPPLNDPRSEQQRAFESVVAWCSELMQRAPLMMVVDDAHWADSGTVSLLRHLARRTRKLPLLIVATHREVQPEEARVWHEALLDLNRERLATRIKLSRLNREQTGDMLAAMFEEEITPEFLDGIYRETEGNPFFVEEVCKALIEEGKIYYGDGRWHRLPMDEIEIPQSLRLAILARVGKLSPETQDTLRLASVLGREFDFGTLKPAGDFDEDSLIAALENAERAQLISEIRTGHSSTVKFAFGHALIRATLYESVSGLRRQRLHHRAALAFEVAHPEDFDNIAQNSQRAGDSDKARMYFARAGARAIALFAYVEAEQNYRAALELGGTEAENAGLLSELGQALRFQSRHGDAIQAWREAIKFYRRVGDDERVAQLYARSARTASQGDDFRQALALGFEGLAALSRQPDTLTMAQLLQETARAYLFNGLPDQAQPLAEKALEIAERVGDVEAHSEALATLGMAQRVGGLYDQSKLTFTRAAQLAESNGFLLAAARAHNNVGVVSMDNLGELIDGRDHFLRAADLSRQARVVEGEKFYLAQGTDAILMLGEFKTAEEKISALRELLSGAPHRDLGTARARFTEASLRRYLGELDEALQMLQSQQVEARRRGSLQTLCDINNRLSEILIELGRWAELEGNLREAIEFGDRVGGASKFSRALLAVVTAHQGKIEESHRLLAESEAVTRRQPTRLEEEWLSQAKARLAAAERQWSEALTLFATTAALQAQMGKRWYRAQTLCESAEVYLVRGEEDDRQRAGELLREAQGEFEQMQVPKYAAQVRDRLQRLEQEG